MSFKSFFWLILIAIIIWNLVQGHRIKRLEQALYGDTLPKKPSTSFVPEPSVSIPPDLPLKKASISPESSWQWEEFFTKKFFGILGALSVVLGIGFFGAWAFSHGLIGPAGRIAVGVLVSLGLLVLGDFMRERYPKYFVYLSSAGIAGLMITTYLARNMYGFLEPLQAFSAYVLEVAVGVFLSVKYNARVLGNFSIVAGLLAPALVQSDPNELGLLAYLLILTLGSFGISLRQKWPEILLLLFAGICIYEKVLFGMLEYEVMMKTDGTHGILWKGFIFEQPWVFIAFSFIVHWLLGLGGIFRSIREKVTQRWEEKATGVTVMEMVLMIISVMTFNGIAAQIFEWKDWSYLGFFILAQGFGLFFLSEYLKKVQLFYFQRIAISGTLIAVVLATILEMGSSHKEWLTVALLLEGVLMVFASGALKDRWMGLLGRLTLFLGSVIGLQLSIWYAGLAIVLYGVGTFMGAAKSEKKWEQVLSLIGVVWFLFMALMWNFYSFSEWINFTEHQIPYLFVLPLILSSGMAYSLARSRSVWSPILGLGSIGYTTLIGLQILNDVSANVRVPLGLFVYGLLLLGYGAVLVSVFMEDKGKHLIDQEARKIITRVALAVTSVMTIVAGNIIFSDPYMTLFYIIWGVGLLIPGVKYRWPHFRYFGIGRLLLVIAKLYLSDVWGWDTGEKVLAFSFFGVALLGMSFHAQKKS